MQLEDLLKTALNQKASDLHVVPLMPPLLRIEGELGPAENYSVLSPDDTRNILFPILSEQNKIDFEKQLALDLAIFYPNLGNFRMNIFHQINGIEAVIRIVPAAIPTFDELGLPPIMKKLLTLPFGLVLITGATGSGKSSTLAAMIDYINTVKAGHIITIEDPIEYLHTSKKSSVTQLQVGRDTTSFSAALRSSLRQDPNVIMLGEMRDVKTVRLALTAAETGHLVLSTLHANSAAATINRIVDIFPISERDRARNTLSETIQGILCQTLVKKIKHGRTAAFEVMLATPGIRHIIAQGMHSHIESTIQTSGDIGMFTMETNLKQLASKGIISANTSRIASSSRDAMKFGDGMNKPKK